MSKTWVKWLGYKMAWGLGLLVLSGCDLEQLMNQPKKLSEVDSKAVGAACRHAGRALEDCYLMNPLAKQSGVFEGWRDMNDYMIANKIEVVSPTIVVPRESAKSEETSGDNSHQQHAGESKSAKSSGGKTDDDYAALPRPPRFKLKPRSSPPTGGQPDETQATEASTSGKQADMTGSAEGVAYSGQSMGAVRQTQGDEGSPQRVWVRKERPKT